MNLNDLKYGDVLACVFLPFVSKARRLTRSSGRAEEKRATAEKAMAYLEVLEPAFKQQGGLSVVPRDAISRFRSLRSCQIPETELDRVLKEACQQIEAIVLLMGITPRGTPGDVVPEIGFRAVREG